MLEFILLSFIGLAKLLDLLGDGLDRVLNINEGNDPCQSSQKK
jgi:hypothetical protein